MSELSSGDLIAERYQAERVLGEGGMGTVGLGPGRVSLSGRW